MHIYITSECQFANHISYDMMLHSFRSPAIHGGQLAFTYHNLTLNIGLLDDRISGLLSGQEMLCLNIVVASACSANPFDPEKYVADNQNLPVPVGAGLRPSDITLFAGAGLADCIRLGNLTHATGALYMNFEPCQHVRMPQTQVYASADLT